MLNQPLEITLSRAYQLASERRHEFLTIEHLLIVLLDNPDAEEVLRACGANLNQLRNQLINFLDETSPVMPENVQKETQPTIGFQRVLQRAVFQVQSSGRNEVSGANVLAAIFSEQESQSVYLLKKEGVGRLDVLAQLSHGQKPEEARDPEQTAAVPPPISERRSTPPLGTNLDQVLRQLTTNLNDRAAAGELDPMVGRQYELERVIQVLCRRRKNNPILIGEPGVGKTAIIEGLASAIVSKSVPETIQKAVVLTLDVGSLIAGTKYRGDFEKRMKDLLDALKKYPHAILFIDEIHTIIGAGAASGGSMDISNLLKPLLSRGELQCIGSTTYQEYQSIFEKDRALSRRFQRIDVKEPSVAETIEILEGLKAKFEKHHQVTYTKEAVVACAELAARHLTDRFMPDKAIDLMDEAGAFFTLHRGGKASTGILDVKDIEAVVAKLARIPATNVSQSDKKMLKHLERDLKMLIYGQDLAIHTLVSAIKLARSGLREDNKPIGSFLFAGPTGVGKTEVTVQLANILGVKLLRFDMSEYMERHTVSRLIGAPPGYVGYEQGGLLTDAVMKHPYAVVLLDEIEKAHPEVYNLLLQVMDQGSLTDSNGRSIDFRHVILVMTTNAGADALEKTSIGFTLAAHASDNQEALKRVFTPEFRNRLDAIVQFRPLDSEIIHLVVDKFIVELEAQLELKKVQLSVSRAAKAWLSQHGYDQYMGARPLKRLIQDQIKRPLAEEILFGRLALNGGHVEIDVKDDSIALEVLPQMEEEALPA